MENILLILYRTVIGYTILVFVMKLMGKREIGQLSLFDLLVLLSIADIMVIGIENFDDNILHTITPIFLLAFAQKVISFLALKSSKIRHFFDGRETVLVASGKLQIKNMRKINYNIDDLLMQLRQKDVRTLDEVEFAILETNGMLSVFTYQEADGDFPLPLVSSGKIAVENLKYSNLTETQLREEIRKRQLTIENILIAYIVNQQFVFIKRQS